MDQKSLETVLSIAICRQSGDKWQSKSLFLTIFDLRSSMVLTFSIAAYPLWYSCHVNCMPNEFCIDWTFAVTAPMLFFVCTCFLPEIWFWHTWSLVYKFHNCTTQSNHCVSPFDHLAVCYRQLMKMLITLEPHGIFYQILHGMLNSLFYGRGFAQHQSGQSWSVSENAHTSWTT